MIVTREALDAWWPPTLSPSGLGRTRLAWCTMAVASHSTRCSTARRTSVGTRSRSPVMAAPFPNPRPDWTITATSAQPVPARPSRLLTRRPIDDAGGGHCAQARRPRPDRRATAARADRQPTGPGARPGRATGPVPQHRRRPAGRARGAWGTGHVRAADRPGRPGLPADRIRHRAGGAAPAGRGRRRAAGDPGGGGGPRPVRPRRPAGAGRRPGRRRPLPDRRAAAGRRGGRADDDVTGHADAGGAPGGPAAATGRERRLSPTAGRRTVLDSSVDPRRHQEAAVPDVRFPPGFDFTDPDLYARRVPLPELAELRRTAPVWWNAQRRGSAGFDDEGFWVVTRHADVRAVSLDDGLYSSWQNSAIIRMAEGSGEQQLAMQRLIMLNIDPPKHTALRGIISRGFTPRAIDSLRAALADRAERIVRAARDAGTGDFVRDVAGELPLQAIAELLGVPSEDRGRLSAWSNQMISGDDPDVPGDPAQAAMEVLGYSMAMAEQRAREPSDDIV